MPGWNEMAWFSFLMGSALKSTAILGLAWVVSRILRGRSAASRHLVWTAAAAGVIALPVLSLALPAMRMPGAGLLAYSTNAMFRAVAVQTEQPASAAQTVSRRPEAPAGRPTGSPPDWRGWLMLAWAAGLAAALAQTMAAFASVWRIRRSAKPFIDRGLCDELSRSLGIDQPAEVLVSAAGSMPMTFGILRPAVFLPSDSADWSGERRRVVLLHELAHIRRGDVATHLLARLALILHWWNPLAWTAWREFLKERERATDDLVLQAGARASEYAGHLLEVARSMNTAPAIGWAAVAMARRSQLEGRLVAILDERVNRHAPGRAAALAAVVVAAGLVAPLAAVRAQDNQAPPTRFRTVATGSGAQSGAQEQAVPADVDAFIRVATSQKNYAMLEAAAAAAERTQQYDTAQKLLESAAAIRASVSGRDSVAYGIGLLKLADLERVRNGSKAAAQLYSQAEQIIGSRAEAAPALIRLGVIEMGGKPPDYARAFTYFQRAQTVDPGHATLSLMWMAIVRERENNPDEAEKLFQNALAASDPKLGETLIVRRIYAQFLRKQGRADEAKEFDAATAAMQKSLEKPRPAVPAGVFKIGDDVKAPRLLSKVEPEYTEEARVATLAGTVVIGVTIGTDGLAHNLQVLRSLGLGLDEKAVEAIERWRFSPGTKGGQPVQVMATIEVNFRLL